MNNEVLSLFHQYLARLIKDHQFDINSTKVITDDDFPDELVVEKTIIKIIHQANSLGVTLTENDIALQLATSYGVVESIQEANNDIDQIIATDTSDSISSAVLVDALKSTATNIKFLNEQEEAYKRFRSSGGPIEERIQEYAGEVLGMIPDQDSNSSYNWEERADHHEQTLRQRHDQLKKFGVVGPSFPWSAMRNVMPPVSPSDLVLTQMTTGVGKSTITPQMCEYQTMVQGYDVCQVTFETPHKEFADRQVARWLNISLDHIQKGYLDLSDKKSKQIQYYYAWRQWMASMQNNHGRLYYDYMPSATPLQVKARIQKRWYQAKARGRQLVVHLDYLQVIPVGGNRDMEISASIRKQVDFAKQQIAENFGVPVFMVAQSHNTNPGVEDRNKKNNTFGGQYPAFRSQILLDGIRPVSHTTSKLIKDEYGETVRDIFGNARFWITPPRGTSSTEAPTATSEKVILTLAKANSGPYPLEIRLFASDDINIWYDEKKNAGTPGLSWVDQIKESNGMPLWEDFQ